MGSFTRLDYQLVYNFARDQYFWHESARRGFDITAALIMHRCEEVLGQQADFPSEALKRLAEMPRVHRRKLYRKAARQ